MAGISAIGGFPGADPIGYLAFTAYKPGGVVPDYKGSLGAMKQGVFPIVSMLWG